MSDKNHSFAASITVHKKTGQVIAVYLKIREGKSAKTKEFAEGHAYADYDRRGRLLGIELLAPCTVQVLDKIAPDSTVRKFVREAIPRQMVTV